MSLRFMSRVVYQAGTRVVQGMKDQASKSLRDSASSSSSKQAKLFCGAFDSTGCKASDNHKLKRQEESLRKIMYLSCWGPN